MTSSRNDGVTADPLFVGVTRPAMAFGVTYSALLVNAVVTVELFLLTRNLLWLLACVPVHGLFWLLCLSEPRFFDLAMLWGKTRGPGLFGNAPRVAGAGVQRACCSTCRIPAAVAARRRGRGSSRERGVNAGTVDAGAAGTHRGTARAVHGAGGARGRAHGGR